MRKPRQKKSGIKSIKDYSILLIFPPQWSPQNPHFALTSLAGHLRKNGYKVIMKDLNVEYYDRVLTPGYLENALRRLLLNYRYLYPKVYLKNLIGEESVEFQFEGLKFLAIEKFLKENGNTLEEIPRKILDAKETLRDPRRFYNPLLLVEAFTMIDKALEMVSLLYHPAKLTFNGFDQPDLLLSCADLIAATGGKEKNLFYDFCHDRVQDLLSHSPDYIGISINSFSQILPGLTLARMLKEAAPPGCHISIGGNFFTRVRDTLIRRPEFFQTFAHSISMGEGEKQLLILAEKLRTGKSLRKVPNFLFLDKKNKVRFTFEDEPEKLENLGFQDLEGLPLEKYFTPELVLCIRTCKGCYWKSCTFCDSFFGVNEDARSIDHLVGEIKYLKEKYGVRHFEFIDESIHPDDMLKMAERFIRENLGVHWFSNARIETAFTLFVLEALHRSGLTMLLWGFETGSPRIMELINKGINVDRRYDVLRDSDTAGIWNFAYVFFGFPTETKQEAMETINSISGNTDIIHSYGRSVFTLGKHALLNIQAEKYGIMDIIEDTEELSSNLHYKVTSGMKDEEIDEMMRSCTRICAEHYDYTLWYYLRYRENIHLYLARYGKDYVRDFKVEAAREQQLHVW